MTWGSFSWDRTDDAGKTEHPPPSYTRLDINIHMTLKVTKPEPFNRTKTLENVCDCAQIPLPRD